MKQNIIYIPFKDKDKDKYVMYVVVVVMVEMSNWSSKLGTKSLKLID